MLTIYILDRKGLLGTSPPAYPQNTLSHFNHSNNIKPTPTEENIRPGILKTVKVNTYKTDLKHYHKCTE